ncbi:hypothetical protein, partial [Serratia marcescens]
MADPTVNPQRGILRWAALGLAALLAACASGPRVIPETRPAPTVEAPRERPSTRPISPGLPQ